MRIHRDPIHGRQYSGDVVMWQRLWRVAVALALLAQFAVLGEAPAWAAPAMLARFFGVPVSVWLVVLAYGGLVMLSWFCLRDSASASPRDQV